jgi:hypothetical protein
MSKRNLNDGSLICILKMWIIVKVYHGDADKVHIETYLDRNLAFTRIEDLKQMVKECLDDGDGIMIVEENESILCGNVYWWNILFNDGLLVTIDAKEI